MQLWRAPGGDDRRRTVRLVPQHARERGVEQRADLRRDRAEQVRGRGLARDQRGDAAQRRLLVREPAQLRARLAVGHCGRDQLGEALEPRLGPLGQRRGARVDDHHAPQLAGDDDRARDRGSYAEPADLRGHLPRQLAPVVHARGSQARSHAAGERVLAADGQARPDAERLAIRRPGGDHLLHIAGLVARHPRDVGPEQPDGLLDHGGEDVAGRDLAGDERRDPPQRGLFVRQPRERAAGLAVGSGGNVEAVDVEQGGQALAEQHVVVRQDQPRPRGGVAHEPDG
jgi:hypothetical protein